MQNVLTAERHAPGGASGKKARPGKPRVNNDKGKRFYASLGDKVVSKAATLESAIRGNVNLVRSSLYSVIDREAFYEALDKQGFRYAMDTYGHPKVPFVQRLRRFVKRMILRR